MAMHDWTRVNSSIFHHFHQLWIMHLSESLNGGMLGEQYYVLNELITRTINPDVLALETADLDNKEAQSRANEQITAFAEAVSKQQDKPAQFVLKSDALVLRQTDGHSIISIIEIVTPDIKNNASTMEIFIEKAVASLKKGYHLMIVDVFPNGEHDPTGVHGLIWERIAEEAYKPPAGDERSVVSYESGLTWTPRISSFGVGQSIPDVQLRVSAGNWISVPLGETYDIAFSHMPTCWKSVIESG